MPRRVAEAVNYLGRRKRPRPAVLAAIVLLHVALLYGLAKALAPGFTGGVEDSVVSAITVTITAPEEELPPPPPETDPEPEEGAQGNPGVRATPKPVSVPRIERPIAVPSPAPQATSTGTQVRSGARDSGEGTGAAGSGLGTGSGRGGSGAGNGNDDTVAVKPSVRSGELNQARDFPVPEGGRSARFGKSVTVLFTVTPEGRATDCTVARSAVDAATTARVCPLVMEKVRFNPAVRADGTPVAARYGYRVDFTAR